MKPDFTINKNFKIDVEETSNAQHTQKFNYCRPKW